MSRLRPPRRDDEAAVLDVHAQMLAEGSSFATGHREVDTWEDYLRRVDRYQYGAQASWVPATFLVADVEAESSVDPPIDLKWTHCPRTRAGTSATE